MKSITTKQAKLYNTLVFQIRSGDLRIGDRIPSERMLGQLNNISRVTVRLVIDALCAEGILERRGRYGIFVTGVPAPGKREISRKASRVAFVYFSSLPDSPMDQVFATVYAGIESFCAGEKKYHSTSLNGMKTDDTAGYDAYLLSGNLMKQNQSFVKTENKPAIVIGSPLPVPGRDSISFDFYEGAYLAAAELNKNGYPKMLFIGLRFPGEKFIQPNILWQYRGLEDYCSHFGLSIPAMYMIDAAKFASGRFENELENIRKLIRNGKIDSLVVCSAVLEDIARDLYLSSDLPVILFSEHILSNFGWGFRQLLADYRQLGIEGMRLLDWRISNPYADVIKRSLPLKMI